MDAAPTSAIMITAVAIAIYTIVIAAVVITRIYRYCR
jgi:hypothetical protein